MAKRPKSSTEITSIRHKGNTRVNIPTEELRDFMAEDEKAPEAMLYPRDPSLDPQLVWKGKDEQDTAALEVPVVPIYIQEKVHPQALIENLRDTARAGEQEPELTLFSDFNGMGDANFDKKVDFYHHDQHWSNRMILGDSLLVMTSLAEKEGLKGKIQMIYFDPPYGIKFGSNWQVSTRKRDVKDGKVEDATRQSKCSDRAEALCHRSQQVRRTAGRGDCLCRRVTAMFCGAASGYSETREPQAERRRRAAHTDRFAIRQD
jgi:adenine-specific DNA-methyltransferase